MLKFITPFNGEIRVLEDTNELSSIMAEAVVLKR
jgi:hypothetical protein